MYNNKSNEGSKAVPSESLKINNFDGQIAFQKYTSMIAERFKAERPDYKDHRKDFEKKISNGL